MVHDSPVNLSVNFKQCKDMKKIFIGIDVSKETLDVSVVTRSEEDNSTVVLSYGKYNNGAMGFRRMVCGVKEAARGVDASQWLFCGETTGDCDIRMCEWLYAHGFDVWRERARQVKDSIGSRRGKDDRADSLAIADYAARNFDKAVLYEPLDPVLKDIKDLFLYRRTLVDERKAAAVRAREKKALGLGGGASGFIYRDAMKGVRSLDRRIKECDRRIMELVRSDAEIERNYRHVTSIKGIAMVNAVAMIVYTRNFTCFKTANKLATYYGVAPFRVRSGTSIDRRSDVRSYSNPMLKSYISEAATVAAVHEPRIRDYYLRLIDGGKPRAVAMNNVKNKLIRIAFSLVMHDCDYEQKHEEARTFERRTDKNVAFHFL